MFKKMNKNQSNKSASTEPSGIMNQVIVDNNRGLYSVTCPTHWRLGLDKGYSLTTRLIDHKQINKGWKAWSKDTIDSTSNQNLAEPHKKCTLSSQGSEGAALG